MEWEQAAYSALLGAMSAGMLEGGPTAVSAFSENSKAKKIAPTLRGNNDVQAVFDAAASADADSNAGQLYAAYVNKGVNPENVTDLQLGRLYQNAKVDGLEFAEVGRSVEKQIKGVFDKNVGTKGNFATQEDVEQYVEYAYLYADETKVKGNTEFPKQKDKIVISKADERFINDVKENYGIDLSNAYHELNDNDIRHIKNSHGEESNEKYPVTVEDLKQIPDIIKNYDDVLYVERNGKKGFYYVKQHNGVTYYLEATNDKNTVLSNKQMIKVSTGTIPDIPELRDAINKKWNIDSAPDDSVPRMYVQDVKNYVPESTIPQSNGGVNGRSGMPATLRAEMLTRNGEKITLEDAKAASGYGDYGAEVLAGAVNNAEGQTFSQVKGNMHLAYLNGRVNKGMRFETDLQREAYYAGKKDAELGRLIAKKKAGYTTVYGEESGFIPNDASKNVSPKMQKALNLVAKDLGVKVMFVDNIFVNKKGDQANAAMGDDGIFRISANSTQPLYELIIHEPFHRMRQLATQEYFDAMNFAVQHAEQLGLRLEQGNGVGTYYEALNNLFTEKGISHDDAKILDELAAQFYQKIVSNDADALRFIQEMNKTEKSRSALQKFMDYVKELIGKLQKAVRKLRNQGEYAAAKQMDMTIKELETARKFYLNAYRATRQRVENRRVEQTWDVMEETKVAEKMGSSFSLMEKESLNNEENNDTINEESVLNTILSKVRVSKVKMKTFPSYDKSKSDTNELSTRWAHRKDVDAGAQAIAFHKDRCYIIEKFDDTELKYIIQGRINYQDYQNIRKELEENARTENGKSAAELVVIYDQRNRSRNFNERGRQSSDGSAVEHRRKNDEIQRMGEEQNREWETGDNTSRGNEQNGGNREGAYLADVSYSLKGEWHTDLTKAQLKMVDDYLRGAGSPESTRITDTANWYMGRLDGDDLFVIYSHKDVSGPTILYEVKGKQAKVELNELKSILEDYEYGRGKDTQSETIDTVLGSGWMQQENGVQSVISDTTRGRSDKDVRVLSGQSQSTASRAFWNVIDNLLGKQGEEIPTVDLSLKDEVEVSPKRTKELLDTIAYLKGQFETTKFAKADPQKLRSMTRKLLKEYSSKLDLSETTTAMEELYRYMANGENGHPAAWDETFRRAKEIAARIAESALETDNSNTTKNADTNVSAFFNFICKS